MTSRDCVLESLLKLASKRADIAALWLYGSRARRSHHSASDYDLAVAFTDRIASPLDRRLRPELLALDWSEALNLPEGELSIVDVAIAPIPLAWTIISEGCLLWDAHPQLRMHQETRIMSRWELDYLNQRKRYA